MMATRAKPPPDSPASLRWRDVRPRMESRADRVTIASTLGGLLIFGGALVLISSQIDRGAGQNEAGVAAAAGVAILGGGLVLLLAGRLPGWFLRVIPFLGAVLVGVAIHYGSAAAAASYAMLFLWVIAAAALFFDFGIMLLHGLVALAIYGFVLAVDKGHQAVEIHLLFAGGSVFGITLAMSGLIRQLHRRMAQLEMTAQTDPLTGVLNRRALTDAFGREISRAQRRDDGALGLIVLDLDRFKTFNDTYGHPAGDVILRRLCDVLVKSSRSEDYIVRLGGEEFAVLAPESDLAGTLVMAERLRRGVELEFSPADERLTVSLGVSAFPENGLTGSDLMAAADKALYEAKAAGRNKAFVSSASPKPTPAS